ncbi:MAG TPA: TIGR03619 family F420-dependent LLM class oxidoreductase [Actinomycetota bacterium]
MAGPRLVMVLSENQPLVPGDDVAGLVRLATVAEAAGFDAVMVSEHVVLGPGADADGRPLNPREYALPGNQDPTTPWPDPVVVLSAVASATSRLRLVAGALIAPLRHPLLAAKQLATLDLVSRGRLVVQPTVSWHRPEYEALGVPFGARGELLDEHLEAWTAAWSETPASFHGVHYRFEDAYVVPKPFRPGGPPLWFGGQTVHPRLLRRLVRYGSGFNPLGRPSDDDLERLRAALAVAGRDPHDLEMVGGTRAVFAGPDDVADLTPALASVPEQVARGFTTICIKPSQFLDDPGRIETWCREVVDRVRAMP